MNIAETVDPLPRLTVSRGGTRVQKIEHSPVDLRQGEGSLYTTITQDLHG